MERRLSAILAADVVGYSRLMGEDETGTLAALRAHREELIHAKIAQHGGRIVKLMGDGLLAEFPSAIEAVVSAVEIQILMAERNTDVPEQRRIVFRIGINIGDVIIEDDDIYGDGVNVAARLEGLADPGGICVARNVRNQIRDKLDLHLEDQGEIAVKNIARPIRVFSVILDESASRLVTAVQAVPAKRARSRWHALVTGTVVSIVAAAGLGWWQPWAPQPIPDLTEPAAPALPDKPSIAVLPFDNLSGDPEQEYFADGLTDDLITDLSKISGLFVIARDSVFRYDDRTAELHQIARELGVRYLLEGSVRRAGETVRINAQLIDGGTGNHLWAERYDRQFADIFTIQDEVIESIVEALAVQLTETERIEVARLPTDNLEAYDYYLRGEKLAYRADPASAANALSLYQRAISLDTEFANAYAGYARVAVDVLTYGYFDSLPSAVARKRAYEAASRAVSLNPRLARSYSVLALLQMLESEHESAVASAQKALEANPNSAEAHLNLAVVLVFAGRQNEALEAMETVLRLNPKPPGYVYEYLALTLYVDQRYPEALAALERGQGASTSDLSLELQAGINARLGRIKVARDAIQDILTRWPETSVAGYRTLFAHHALEEDLEARLDGLRLAGLPEWPYGFEGDPALRLDGASIDALTKGRTWIGERVGIGPFTQFTQADGGFIERGPDYQMIGTASRQDDLLCLRSPAMLMGRQACGPIFRNASGTAENQDEYTYPNAYRLKRFSVKP
ncbi:MAG: tetratricopeptide repeat protein [Paracoccaceae bacterium]|nr:tetratricopeptide repeat protein [Paracoccaceae bacterium]